MTINDDLEFVVKQKGADFIHFVDVSKLSEKQNKQFNSAVLVGFILSPIYVWKITNTPDYVPQMIRNKQINTDEFHLKEKEADQLADFIANYLMLKGYTAYAQSEDNLYLTGSYNDDKKCTPLPNKTIAVLAGLGWIGKNNLLVTPESGCAVCICSVLTDAPLKTVLYEPTSSKCGDCTVCSSVCSVGAIKENTWNNKVLRDELVDVYKCNCCLKCLVFCPWTQKYMKRNIKIN